MRLGGTAAIAFSALLLCGWFPATLEAACPPPGSGIVVSGTTTTESGCTITTAAINTPGTSAALAGTIDLSNSSITTTATGSYGGTTDGAGSSIGFNTVSISTSSAHGLFLNGGQITFNSGSITTSGGSINGAQLLGTGSVLALDQVNLQVNGASGVGLLVQLGGNSVNASNCTIVTTANGARGVDIGLGSGTASSGMLNNCTLNIAQGVGPPSFGAAIARNGSTLSVENSTVNSEVYGVHTIADGASITVDNSTIAITASASVFGAYAQNSTTITLQNDTEVTTTGGNNAHGFVVQDGSTGNINDSSVQTSGTNAQGIFIIGFSTGNQVNVSGSTVSTSGTGANAIQAFANAGITSTVEAEDATFSATNADVISVGGGIASLTFTDVTALAATGRRLLVVDGSNPASTTWSAGSSTLSGNIEVVAGNTASVTLGSDTDWTGASLDVTNLILNDGDWHVSANSTITNQLTNDGLVDFVSEGNVVKTLTVDGPYVGAGGTVGLNTFLGTSGSNSDLLILDGVGATGTTVLNIKNTVGAGAQTTGNGILVVSAINGATTASNAFSLASPVIAGSYRYELFRGSVDSTGPQNWYLRSTFITPVPTLDRTALLVLAAILLLTGTMALRFRRI